MGPCLVYPEASWVSAQVRLGYLSGQQVRQGKVLGEAPAPLNPNWGRKSRQWWRNTSSKAGPMNGLSPAALNLLFLSPFLFKFTHFFAFCHHIIPPAVSTTTLITCGARILMQRKRSKATSLRPNFCRSNTETVVAINRSWLIYRKRKWNHPFCKRGLRASDLRHTIHLFMFELSHGLCGIRDDEMTEPGAIIH